MKTSIQYQRLSKLSDTKFRRYTGVIRYVFDIIVLIVKAYDEQTKVKSGRPPNLSVEDQVYLWYKDITFRNYKQFG